MKMKKTCLLNCLQSKKIVWVMIIFIAVFSTLVSAYVCQDETDLQNIPCEVITPVMGCVGNASIISTTDSSECYNYTMTLRDDGTYNFSFNLSTSASYSIVLCDNSSTTITLGHFAEDWNNKWMYFYGVAIGLGALLTILGINKEDYWLTILAGILFIAFAITFISRGYPTLTNETIKLFIILIPLGIGSYLMLFSGINIVREGM